MELHAEAIDLVTRSPTVVLNAADARELGVNPLDRVQVRWNGRSVVCIVEVTEELVPPGELGATERVGHLDGMVEVTLAPRPRSVQYVRKKLDGIELEPTEVRRIAEDITEDRLSDIELSAYVTAVYTRGFSSAETLALTEAMTGAGDRLSWDTDVVADKHSIGGVAGNRVTPVLVPIVVAAGVTVPKTSSRAITSPAGTADTMEVFCNVSFDADGIRRIVDEAGGCLVWGGGVDLSPADDRIIRAEYPLSLDPQGQLVASVLSKKRSAGSTHVVLDVPYGEDAKTGSLEEARELAEEFKKVADHLGLHLTCAITRGNAPIGRGIGPVLEARDVLAVLSGDGPEDLRQKSVRLAGLLLDACGVNADADELLESGAAERAFRDIVAAQGGDRDVSLADLTPGEHTHTLEARRPGVVSHVDNGLVSEVARRAGAPRDAGAGLELQRRLGEEVAEGDALLTVYAEHEEKLEEARGLLVGSEPIRVRPPGESVVEHL
ncbi:AMP phosphorylase [Salinirubellus salinus]|uniref:AMP phosphorylase n=1 Tax=Salinirubellus salinus TaxID=1364945 RepID=A0A9E7R847_9EURY|nr:AMP phosphorylase [Salinirubellus salinus]UWM56348.1 AMP phosphorylase [Salinirubellus salinus]